jgi:hypothetical protein
MSARHGRLHGIPVLMTPIYAAEILQLKIEGRINIGLGI